MATLNHICSWCGRKIDKMMTYIILGHHTFCSKKCHREWLEERERWENEGGHWHGD